MHHNVLALTCAAVGICALASPCHAQYADDEFNGTLGSQWVQVDSTPTGSSFGIVNGTHFQILAQEGSDFYFSADRHAYIEQDAPAGTSWEIVTKIDNFDPINNGQRPFIRAGIQIWQDDDHWISIGVRADGGPNMLQFGGFYQMNTGATEADTQTFVRSEEIPFGPSVSYWLKLIKSTKGYLVQGSLNGVDYVNLLPPVRNPDTADGYLTGEKIRLYESGGSDSGGSNRGDSTPADFDFIRKASITTPPAGYTDDEFDGTALGSTWTYVPGYEPGTIEVSGGALKMTAGPFSQLWFNFDRAMRVIQDAPNWENMDVTIKASPADLRSYEAYNSYGLILWQDPVNFAMISNQPTNTDPQTNRVEYLYKFNETHKAGNVNFGTDPCPEYLRIVQSDNNYICQYSFDNVTWTSVLPDGTPEIGVEYPTRMKNAQVHLFGKRSFGPTSSVPNAGNVMTTEFDWIHAHQRNATVSDWTIY